MSKVSLIAKLPLKPGSKDTFLAAFAPMLDQVDAETGTELYLLNFQKDDENIAWIYELYTDDDAMAAHSSSDAMAALFGALGDVLDGAPELIPCLPHAGKGSGL